MSIRCLQRSARSIAARLGALAPLSIIATIPVGAAAQTQLDPVVVTGTREPQALARSSADIVVIDADTIRRSTADSVEDLLRREAGMQLTRTGGPGQASGYFLRGASTNGTVVLVDGVRIGSATLGQAEFEGLSLAQVDHVEVLRGPASSLYGADAVGGVIQIFTRKGAGDASLVGGAQVGGYRSREGDLGVSGASGAFDYAVSAGRESSRGVSAVRPNDQFGLYNPDNDGYTRNFGNLRLGYTPAAGHRIGINVLETKLNAQYDSAEYNADFVPDPTPDFRNHLTTRVVALDYRGVVSPLWTTTLQLANNVDDATSGGTRPARLKTDRDQATWQNAFALGSAQQVVLAYEYLRERADGDAFADGIARRNHGFVLGYAGGFGPATLEASVRHDRNSAYGDNTTGSVGASYAVVDGLKLRARAGTSFRAPTFNDLGYPFYGVPTIKPERGRSIEVGAAWQTSTSALSVTLYRNHVTDLIGYDPDPQGTDCPRGYFGCAANIARARLQGATLAGSQRWGGFSMRATVDLVDARDDDTGMRLTRRAAHQESVDADYDGGTWSAGAALLDVGARPDGGVRLGAYALLDLRASWRFQPQWRLEAKLTNALDHRVEPIRDYQGLGRQAWLGIRFDGKGL